MGKEKKASGGNSATFGLISQAIKQLPSELRKLKNEGDWANALATFSPLLNSNPVLSLMFLSNPYGFCEDFGIEVGSMLKEHLEEQVELFKYVDTKLYKRLKNGERVPGVGSIKLVPTPFLKKAITLKGLIKNHKAKSSKSVTKAILPNNSGNGSEISVTNTASSALFLNANIFPFPSTRGWTVVMQVTEDYISDLFEKIMETQFNIATLIGFLSGDDEFDGIAEPWHSYSAWLGFVFHVNFQIEFIEDDEPGISIEAVRSNEVKARFKIKGVLQVQNNSVEFEGIAEQTGRIIRDEPARSYYIDFTKESPVVTLDGDDDSLLELLVAFAVFDFFDKELPTLQLFSLPDQPPFLFFEQSALFSADAPGDLNALTWTFGDSTQRVDPFDRYIVRPGFNITLGQSAAAMQFIIRRDLPELPLIPPNDPNIRVDSIDIELRNGAWNANGISGTGYVEVTGTGRYRTCDCFPDVDFSYSVNIGLTIDNNGNLREVIINSGVGLPAWLYIVNGVILGAIGLVGAGPLGGIAGGTIGLIGTAIAEGVLGSEVANNLDGTFALNANIQEQLNDSFDALNESTAGFISLSSTVTEVEINPTGVFFHGNLVTEAILGYD